CTDEHDRAPDGARMDPPTGLRDLQRRGGLAAERGGRRAELRGLGAAAARDLRQIAAKEEEGAVEYRNLGKSGLKVSAVGLGCNNFAIKCDAQQTKAIVNRALDEGVTLFDTADIYGNRGGSEELLGKALGKRRREVVVASKFGMSMGDGPYLHGASRRYVMAAAEDSLRRLGTDYIDLYQLHTPDADTPQEETLEALADLVHAGKVRYLGCSNFTAWQLAEALGISRARGLPAYISAQNEYSRHH